MSPSKMRKSNWYHEGATARLIGIARDANPYDGDPAHYVRRRAWFQGWDEATPEPERVLTPVEAILASVRAVDIKAERERTGEGMMEIKRRLTKDAVGSAIGAAETVDDLKAILDVLVEELVR